MEKNRKITDTKRVWFKEKVVCEEEEKISEQSGTEKRSMSLK